jgi:hypothetical protein
LSDKQRQYMRRKYEDRKREAQDHLGGRCVVRSTEVDLEFDHIDPGTKSFTITDRLDSAPWTVIEEELQKCQLLCAPHHLVKTTGGRDARRQHGTLSSYRYCKCAPCRAAKAVYMREYKARRKAP